MADEGSGESGHGCEIAEHKITVRAVDRALDILSCFTDATDLSMTDLAAKVGLHKSTVYRLLASLEARGFVIRDQVTEKYRLGFRIWELAANLSQTDDPAMILLPEMERLRDALGETISLYIRDGNERIRIQALQSTQSVRRVAPIGDRLPLYVGASGKALVAFTEPVVREQLLSAVNRWPAGVDREWFRAQIEPIRRNGYATSVEEREPGAAAIAAPILNRTGKLIAALSVSGPVSRLTLERMRQHAPLIIETAKRMGKMIK